MIRKSKVSISFFLFALLLLLGGGVMAGCSTEDNPVTPEKMSEMRKKEANERANFNPDTKGAKPGN